MVDLTTSGAAEPIVESTGIVHAAGKAAKRPQPGSHLPIEVASLSGKR